MSTNEEICRNCGFRIADFGLRIEGASMFGRAQKQAKTGANARGAKLHSIASVMRGRSFAGRFEVGGVTYPFTYTPEKGAVTGDKLQLTGSLTVIDGRSNARANQHSLRNVRATLVATQGGVGTAPPRNKMPAEISPPRPDLPIIESTGALSFCGVLYFKLAPLDGRALGVPADLRQVQLNVRLAPVSDTERGLQGEFSSIVDALYGERIDRPLAEASVGELNKVLSGS
jgi:hypothetical protein